MNYTWTGGNTVEVAGVRGMWIPNEPVDVSAFTSAEIATLENCPGMMKVSDEPKAKKPSGEEK
jgi:hypothetical protein